ncbi:hypothetical protein [Hydrogenophaga sp.]|uniref:hypothetical protein n=1 Tax=Hydrogenophaga sp. TaxID=1904254 RepID=UPI003F717376
MDVSKILLWVGALLGLIGVVIGAGGEPYGKWVALCGLVLNRIGWIMFRLSED